MERERVRVTSKMSPESMNQQPIAICAAYIFDDESKERDLYSLTLSLFLSIFKHNLHAGCGKE
jgi:hypothetical protein